MELDLEGKFYSYEVLSLYSSPKILYSKILLSLMGLELERFTNQ